MESHSLSPNNTEIASAKTIKKPIRSTILAFNTKKSKLPDKDKQFLDELMKRNNEGVPKTLKNPIMSFISEGSARIRGISLKPEKIKSGKKAVKCTTSSDFKQYENLSEHRSIKFQGITQFGSIKSIENNTILDTSYKYFVGNGNNDNLVRKILNIKPGWVKTFSPATANLIWTEVKQIAIFDLIPSLAIKKKKTLESNLNNIEPQNNTQGNDTLKSKIYNKIEGNKELASKKRLFVNMSSYYKSIGDNPFKYLPLTLHIVDGTKDPSFKEFIKYFRNFQKEMQNDEILNNCWLVKPGESTNRGIGITVCSTVEEVSKCIDEKKFSGTTQRTYIVQKYLYKPMLYRNRKFDIRCYALITIINGKLQAYFYRDGYLRTSCQEFNMDNIHERFIHLTNDAVQKNSPDYGRYEDGNKLSYEEFQEYINESVANKANFKSEVYPKMKKIVTDTIKATWKRLDPKKRTHTFEILGYDFMLDEMYSPWLLEINTNPCLALSGSYLAKLIPMMLTHAFEIALDQLFSPREELITETSNKFELIFTNKKS